MVLLTKSIQKKKTIKDGIRICIMRRPDGNADYDIWMPTLAPPNVLLTEYHQNKISWEGFIGRFTKEVLNKNIKYIKLLSYLAFKYDISILCWEETPEKCHRRLVAEQCKKKYPKLIVIIN